MNITPYTMKRLCVSALLLLFCHVVRGQEFFDLPASDYPVGEVFQTQLRGVRGAVLEYPEFVPLTRAEVRRVEELGLELPELPQVELFVGVERKQPVLDVSFLPLVKRGGRYYRVTSVKVTPQEPTHVAHAPRLQAASSERYANHSVLADGRWVKIHVSEEGIYRLTASQLSSMGFSNPASVRLYGYGGRILPERFVFSGENALIDDLCEMPLLRTGDGLLFFAEGVLRLSWDDEFEEFSHSQNPYSRYSYYFLTEGGTPEEFSTLDVVPAAALQVDKVWNYELMDNDAHAWYGGGRNFADAYDFASGASHSYTLAAPGCVEGTQAVVDVAFTAAGQTSTTGVSVKLGGSQLGTMNIPAFVNNESAREVIRSFSTDGLTTSNVFSFATSNSNPARLDYISATYKMRLSAKIDGKSFSPYTNGAVTLQVADAGSDTELWRIGEGGTPTSRVPVTLNGTTLTATVADGMARYVIVNTEKAYAAPTSDGIVPNQDLHGDASAYDMVIIVPQGGKLDEQAERLAAYHREADGLRVKVVSANLLYNEFSSGTPDASAYRRYVKMLYDRAASDEDAPRYLLFFGSCFYDNRGVTAEGKSLNLDDFLLSYEPSMNGSTDFAIGTLNSYVTDDYFGLLDDGEGALIAREKTDLAIGRIPTHEASDAKILVDKILAYGRNENVGTWKNRLVFIGDDIDNNIHMKGAESALVLSEEQAGSVVSKRIYLDAYRRVADATHVSYPDATVRMKTEMDRGALMFNYTGHGGSTVLSHARLVTLDDFVTHASPYPALWTFAACEILPYDQQEEGLGNISLFRNTGGAIAIMCSSRAVYASYNSALNDAFCRYLFSRDTNGRRYTMGEALWLCKNILISSGKDATNNKLKYVLLGDPALTLHVPTGKVVLDSINGQCLNNSSYLQLKAGEVVRFSGHVEGAEDFMGTVTATLFDRLETVTCLNNAKTADTPMTFQDRTAQLYEGSDSVRAGKFSMQIVIPRAISYTEDAARIVFYAVNTEHSLEAHGESTQFYLDGTDTSQEVDVKGPVVVPYLGDPDFVNGSTVSSEVVFYATINDESGINTTSASVGHDMELVLDGNTTETYVLNDFFQYDFGSYRSGTIAYPLTGLSDGSHTLSLRVWDVYDNSTTATIYFTVNNNATTGINVFSTNNPVKGNTRFIVQGINPDSDQPVTLEVYDVSGRRVWAHTFSAEGKAYATTAWSLTTASGVPVPAGIYILRAVQGDTESKGSKLIVVRH